MVACRLGSLEVLEIPHIGEGDAIWRHRGFEPNTPMNVALGNAVIGQKMSAQ